MFKSKKFTTVAVFIVLMIDSMVNGLFIPLSLIYLEGRSGTSLTQIGLLLSLAGIIALPIPLWAGRLVDRLGARSVVLVAQALQAAGFIGYVLVSDLRLVFLAAILVSLGRGAFWSSVYSLVSRLSDEDADPRGRERWLGAVGALRAVGYGLGALVAGVALSVHSQNVYRAVIAVNAALLVVAAVLVIVGVPAGPTRAASSQEPNDGQAEAAGAAAAAAGAGPEAERGYRVLWADRPFLALTGLNTIFALCNVMLSIAFPTFVAHSLRPVVWVVGPLLVMNTVVQALCLPLVVRMLRRVPRQVSICLAGVLWASWSLVTMSALWVPDQLRVPCLALAILCYSSAQLVHSPVSNAMATDAAPFDVRGRYLATFQYSFAIAAVVAPTLFAVLFGAGEAVPWATLALLALLAVPGMLLLARHLPQAALTGVHRPADTRSVRDVRPTTRPDPGQGARA